ncbi:TPA: type I DNA topoisomerase, partial [Vibrio cholerae]
HEETSPDILCPECSKGHLIERKSRFGKLFYACDAYPKCKFALNGKPIAQACAQCGFTVMVEKKSSAGMRYQCANRQCGHIQEC